jgi:hypothetical protein
VKREALLEFDALYRPHSGEDIARVMYKMLNDLDIKHKALALTRDNASIGSDILRTN